MEKNITKMKGKKALSMLLSLIMVLSVLTPAFSMLGVTTSAATTNATGVYSTLFTMSDLQKNGYLTTVKSIMTQIVDGGVTETPDALLFGGDFQTSSNAEESISHHMDIIEDLFNDFYPYYHSENLVYIKGNHDLRDERHTETGLHEFEDFYVYTINEDDYSAGNLSDAQTASANLQVALDRLLANGNDKPVFVMTHVPFHHNPRGDYKQSAYGRYLFNVLNQYGASMDIVFMFGHNHSGDYDDYIGGSVNYLAVGEKIRISEYGNNGSTNIGQNYYTEETLNFTYMNYGYAGYSNNTNGNAVDPMTGETVQSTDVTTMGVLEICPDKIVVSRYATDGKYGASEIITRKTPANEDGSYDEAYVNVVGYPGGTVGTQTGAYANATGFSENATYTWKSSNNNIAKVIGNGPVGQVAYLAEGSCEITVTVTDGAKTASDTYTIAVAGQSTGTYAEIRMALTTISGTTLEYYDMDFPSEVFLLGVYQIAGGSATNQKWTTSDASVATVSDGCVRFVDNGTVTITFSFDNNGTTYSASTTFVVSNGAKQVYSNEIESYTNDYTLASSLVPGNRYIIYAVDESYDTDETYDTITADCQMAISNESSGNYLKGVSITPVNDVITTENNAIVWVCEQSSTSGYYRFKNLADGTYLVMSYDANKGTLSKNRIMTTTLSEDQYNPGAYMFQYFYTSSYGGRYVMRTPTGADLSTSSIANQGDFVRYNSGFIGSSSPANIEIYQAGTTLALAATEQHIEMGGEFVEDTTKNVYKVTDDTSIKLYGSYKNFGQNVVESWASSNSSVATIDENGVLDFTGNSGSTTITYKIKSDSVSEQTLEFTLVAKTAAESKRIFKLVDKMEHNKPYVIVYKDDVTVGDGFALTTDTITKKALFPADIEIKENAVNDYLYVEIPESESGKYVWASGGTVDGEYYLTTEESIRYFNWSDSNGNGAVDEGEFTYYENYTDGEVNGVANDSLDSIYLGAQITGMGEWGVEGKLYTTRYGDVIADLNNLDLTPYQFSYDSKHLYNKYQVTTDAYYDDEGELVNEAYSGVTGVSYHSSGYFGIDAKEDSKILIFEEIVPEPTAVIISNYEYIGKNVARDEVCPDQTELLTAKAEGFPEGEETVEWSSSNPAVATIDQNGKITYTGKSGVTTISLTVSVYNDVEGTVTNTQTVKIFVNGGTEDNPEINEDAFYLTTALVPGQEYVLAHTNVAFTGDNASKNDGLTYAISNSSTYNSGGVFAVGVVNEVVTGTPDYIETPTNDSIWICEASEESGYYYFKSKSNPGQYLAIEYDAEGSNDIVAAKNKSDLTNQDSFLIAIDGKGKMYSKSSTTSRGVGFNYGSSASSTKRFYATSSTVQIDLYSKKTGTPTGDIYYLTDSFIPGNKYIVALSGTEGSTTAINNTTGHSSNGYDYLLSDSVIVESVGANMAIANPPTTSVWECFASETSGYYYLKDENDNYLVVVCDESTATSDSDTPQSVTITSDKNAYDAEEYLLKYKASSSGGGYFGSKASEACGWYLYNNSGNGRNYSMRYTSKYYLYALEESNIDPTLPVTQVRVDSRYGSKDITDTIYNRYNISNGDTEQMLRYVVNVNEDYSYEWSVDDESIATIDADTGVITYTGEEGYVRVSLTVTGTDVSGNAYTETATATLRIFSGSYSPSAEDYPDYPYEGSVHVNKTASNLIGGQNFQYIGVSEVELSVTGVPVEQPVDVVVILDHSSSMNSSNLLSSAIEDTRDFALQILDKNPNNRVAVVAFDSMGSRYTSLDTTEVKNTLNEAEAGVVTGDNTATENAFITPGKANEDAMVEQLNSLMTNNVGNTNYDYGLKKAYDILKDAKDNGSNNMPIVVFMSDGSPNQFNGLQTSADSGYMDQWLKGDKQYFIDNGYLNADGSVKAEYPAMALFNENGDNWYSQALKAPAGEPSGLPAFDYYADYQYGLGVKLFTIGYATEDTYGSLTRMASAPDNYYNAASNLQAAYDVILDQILKAANDAVVTDKMGDKFDLQFATTYDVPENTITLNPAPSIEVGAWTLNNEGQRVEYKVYETITFTTNSNGTLASATSSLLGDGVYDVANSKIIGQYVTYDLNTETFSWNVGDITRDEVVLKYYAALEGFKEGIAVPGVYDTNDYATLDYVNFRGTQCQQTFPVPTIAYKNAAIGYEFYLVNNQGQPVNRQGDIVNFANRILVGNEQTKQIYLSDGGDGSYSYTLEANAVVPSGYKLYNTDAAFTITGKAGVIDGAVITDEGSPVTTYYREGSDTYQGEVPEREYYYNTHVSFGVVYETGIVPDTVVIDFGLPVKINALVNDLNVETGTLNAISATKPNVTFNTQYYTSSQLTDAASSVTLKNGTAEIVDGKILYTPASTNYTEEEVLYYEYKTGDRYYYTTVTIIPATSIYFEESMFTFTDSTVTVNGEELSYEWQDVGTPVGERLQAEDRPGTFTFADADANNVYGTDSAYSDSATYSMGSAKYITVDKNSNKANPLATASFTFTGTGFDLFTVTDNKAGLLTVSIFKDGTKVKGMLVNTYYGYTYDSDAGDYVVSEGDNALFQVPAIRARDLAYDTYTVVVEPKYSSAFDIKGAEEYRVYVDSVRIFDPMGSDNAVANEAYLADGEYAANYLRLRDTVITKNADGEFDVSTYGDNSSLFFDGYKEDGNQLSDAIKNGPKNEVYLAKGQAIAFKISTNTELNMASLQVGMKLVDGSDGKTATVSVFNTNQNQAMTGDITSATEQFYKLDSVVVWDQSKINAPGEESTYETVYPIVIMNTSEDDVVISLTSLKWGYKEDAVGGATASVLNIFGDEQTPALAYSAMQRVMATPAAEEPVNPVAPENVDIDAPETIYLEDGKGEFTVTTETEITKVTVNGVELTDCEINEDGKKAWNYSFNAEQLGETIFRVVVYDYEGNQSMTIVNRITVIDEDGNDGSADSGETDDGTQNENSSTDDIFSNDLVKKIFDIIRKILEFLGGAFA